MAYETKVIIRSIARILIRCKSIKQAYNELLKIAQDEGVNLQTYEDAIKELNEEN
jgi:hypothetical protein